MKKLTLGFLVLLSASAFAQELTCLDKLLPFNRYSGSHLLTKEEWTDNKDVLDSASAEAALKSLVGSKLLCKQTEVVVKVNPVCHTIISDIMQSNTCFIFTNVGYFSITKDNGKNINFVFNKDKRFSEQ